ncbi:transcriptional and immune response regulator isoform X2 [Narcine bancroftii]|uniref:transcriptional and immune response regulator isoform X2 n=1 Tax=Narcine bancroftii TaxID=1343680 RepID=UPI0038313244
MLAGMEPSPVPCPVCPAWFGSRWERKSRKKARANIFQDVELGQMQALFRKSGDENAEERARIIWEKERQENQDIAQALMELKCKKTQLFFKHNKSGAEFLGLIWVKAFNKLRIKDGEWGCELESSGVVERSQRSKIKRKRLTTKRPFSHLL